jgi:uncharacterized protein (DUF433 family)
MLAVTKNIGLLIAWDPEIRSGRPILAGTGVSVRSVVIHYKHGLTPEQIADQFGHLSLAQVYAALTYYHANREEIETDLEEDERLYNRLASEHEASKIMDFLPPTNETR